MTQVNYDPKLGYNHCIITPNDEARDNGWDWDEILYNDAYDVVMGFDTYAEAEEAFINNGYDCCPEKYALI